MKPALARVVLFVRDAGSLAHWYRETFGLTHQVQNLGERHCSFPYSFKRNEQNQHDRRCILLIMSNLSRELSMKKGRAGYIFYFLGAKRR